ncbi:acyl-CoA dehydrogenase family protein [Brachybacterium timonense]|uniref:acyl-CoA dehydrogenase family protein n=1 Tax=Brachybacterium timonense TaxID=2050896 RepID=UPI000D0AF7EB|nr:acyl-CoA dehydrogenase family protein [Brachybacterium timonense]
MTDTAVDLTPESFLPDELVATFRERAAQHDRENTFFDADLVDLRGRGYLKLLVPTELGGFGASLLEVTRIQRRLAAAAPATALGMNMHQVIMSAALFAWMQEGNETARGMLEAAARGELFAFGISEGGNEAMLFDAFTEAEPDGEGGYRFSGTKIFTTLSPAWDHLVVHGRRTDTGEGDPELVFAYLDREPGVSWKQDWDTHGMRATQSHTTVLDAAPASADRVITQAPVGPNRTPFVFGIFGPFELLLAAVYIGIAERAIQVGADAATTRRTRTRGIPYADDPDTRWRLADAAFIVDGVVLQIEKVSADLDALREGRTGTGITDHGARWFLHFSGVKCRATDGAITAVDQVLRASGGSSFYVRSELERLSRDVRAGMYQPSDAKSTHNSYATALLGDVGTYAS